MATSSITRNFVVEGEEQVEMFANAIEESWQESLLKTEKRDLNITFLQGRDAVERFMSMRSDWNE